MMEDNSKSEENVVEDKQIPKFREERIHHPIERNNDNTLSGGSSTYRGSYKDGIVAYLQNNSPIWIPKHIALRLAHTAIEAMHRYWDVIIDPSYVKNDTLQMAENLGYDVKLPYREACPFCGVVLDDDEEMMRHLNEDHYLIIDSQRVMEEAKKDPLFGPFFREEQEPE